MWVLTETVGGKRGVREGMPCISAPAQIGQDHFERVHIFVPVLWLAGAGVYIQHSPYNSPHTDSHR